MHNAAKDTAHIFKVTIHPTLQKGINKIEHLSNNTPYMPAEMMNTTASDERRSTTVPNNLYSAHHNLFKYRALNSLGLNVLD